MKKRLDVTTIAIFCAFILMAMIAGCAVAPLKATSEVSADRGVVVIRLTMNRAPAGLIGGYQNLEISGDAGIYELERTTVGAIRSGVFTGALPPGRYRIRRFVTHGYLNTMWVRAPSALGTFTVQPGQLTDLGTVIYHPVGGERVVFARTRMEEDTRELVAAEFPRVAEAVLARPILGWDENLNEAEIAEVLRSIRALAAPVNEPRVAPSGAVYAGSILGQVLIRPAGEMIWRQLDTGTTREILTVTEEGGAIVAGGEEGFLVRSSDGGRSWQRVRAPDRGAILHLASAPGGGLFAVTQRGDDFAVWQSSTNGWQARANFPYERSYNVQGVPPHVFSTPTKLYVAMPNGAIHIIDYASGRSERNVAPFSLMALFGTTDGVLYGWGATILQSSWISEDDGKTWRDLNTSRRAGAPAFTDRNTGYVIYVKEIFGGKFSVQMTRDGGRTWEETGNIPDVLQKVTIPWRPMVIHPSGLTLLAFGINGSVFSSRDRGATWTQERAGAF